MATRRIDALDLTSVRRNLFSSSPVTVTSLYDLNRDARVNALDMAIRNRRPEPGGGDAHHAGNGGHGGVVVGELAIEVGDRAGEQRGQQADDRRRNQRPQVGAVRLARDLHLADDVAAIARQRDIAQIDAGAHFRDDGQVVEVVFGDPAVP